MYKFKVKDLNKKDKELKKLMKRCKVCGEMIHIKKFKKQKTNCDGRINICYKCRYKIGKNNYSHICKQCGYEFKSGHKNQKYCSKECVAKSQESKIQLKCSWCGEVLNRTPWEIDNQKNQFCSRECYYNWKSENQKGKNNPNYKEGSHVDIKCSWCGKIKSIHISELDRCSEHFCSVECKGKWQSKNAIGEKGYNYNPNKTEEEREWDKEHRKYSDYYKWRRQVYERDNYTCQCCRNNKSGTLNAHHLNGYNWDKENRTDVLNGITLCESCHDEFHSIYGKGNNTIEQFREFLYNKYLQTKDIKYLVTLKDIDIRNM